MFMGMRFHRLDHGLKQLRKTLLHYALVFFGATATLAADGKPSLQLARIDAHSAAVTGIEFSPDGKFLVSAGRDNRVRVWDVKTRRRKRGMRIKMKPIERLALSPQGIAAVSGGDELFLVRWATGEFVQRSGASGTFQDVDFSTDGWLMRATGDVVFTTDLMKSYESFSLPFERVQLEKLIVTVWTKTHSLALAGRPNLVAVATVAEEQSRRARARRGVKRDEIRPALRSAVRHLKKRKGIYSQLELWKPAERKRLARIRDVGYSTYTRAGGTANGDTKLRSKTTHYCPVAFSPDGQTLLAGRSLIDVKTRKIRIGLENDKIFAAAFSPQGTWLATIGGSRQPGTDGRFAGTLQFWATATGKLIESIDLERLPSLPSDDDKAPAYDVAVAADGNIVATSVGDTTIRLWDASRIQRQTRIARASRIDTKAAANTVPLLRRETARKCYALGMAWTKAVFSQLFYGEGEKLQAALTRSQSMARDLQATLPPLPKLTGKKPDKIMQSLQHVMLQRRKIAAALAQSHGQRESAFFDLAVGVQLVPPFVSIKQDDMTDILRAYIQRAADQGGLAHDSCSKLLDRLKKKAPIKDIQAARLELVGSIGAFLKSK